jgi:hypothetical protein
VEVIMVTLRSAMMAGVIALGCVGISQPADAQRHGGFGGGRGFDHGGFGGNRFFFGFGFGGYGYGGYPYYPYYPGYYYPPYYPYPYYPGAYPAGAPGGYPGAAPGGYPGAAPGGYSGATSAVDPAMVREVQAELQRRGYNVGPVDGRLGPRTKTAIREYEQRNGLPADGSPSRSLRDHMQSHPTG